MVVVLTLGGLILISLGVVENILVVYLKRSRDALFLSFVILSVLTPGSYLRETEIQM